jgi:hypothetical protein
MAVTNRGFEQPRIPTGSSEARLRRGLANLAGDHSVLKELGIGTNEPDTALHVLREVAGAGITLERIQATVNAGSVIGKKARGTYTTRAAVVDDDVLLNIDGRGFVGATNEYLTGARIQFEVDGTPSDSGGGAMPARILFRTSKTSGSPSERMRIDADGNVGIGMNNPSTLLTVEGAITLKEQASADADVAAYGQVWVKTASPNQLYFTTDAGDDIQITDGTALAGGSGSGDITAVTIQTDSGSGSKASDTSGSADFTLLGGSGIDVTNSGVTITVAGEDATTSNKGVASFHSDNFSVSSGAVTIKDQGVLYAEIQNVSATDRILGRDSSGAGVIEEITPANLRTMINVADGATTYSAGDGLDLSGTTFSTDLKSNGGLVIESTELAVDLGASSITGTLAVGDGGSGQTSYTNGQLLIGNTTGNTLAKATLTAGSNVSITNGTGTISIAATNTTYTAGDGLDLSGTTFSTDLKANGGLVIESTEAALDLGASSITGTLAVGDGGSGQTSYTNGQLLIGNTTGNTLAKATLTAGTGISITNGSGSVTIANTVTDTNTTYSPGTLLDVSGTTFNVDLTEAAEAVMANGDYILFLDGGATGSHAKEAIADVATLFAGDGLTASSSVMAVNVDDSTIETNSDAIRVKDNGVTLAKMAGLTRGKIIYGDASGDPAALTVGSNTYVLTSDGTDVAWAAAAGGGVSLSGSTNNTVATVTGSNALIGEANLTFNGNSLAITTGSSSAIPCTITGASGQSVDLFVVEANGGADYISVHNNGSVILGLAGTRVIQTKEESGTNAAGKDIFIKGGKSTGNGEGGDIRFYASPAGSSGSSVNGWAEVLKMRHDKVLDFKISAATKTGSGTATSDFMSSVEITPSKWLEVKIGGVQYFLPAFAASQFS